MENTPISQPKNNKLTITLSVLIILLVIVGGVGMFLMIQQNNHQQQEIKNLKTQIENSAKRSENEPVETNNQAVKKLTWKSEITNLKFDYPESWTIKVGDPRLDLFGTRNVTLMNKTGKTIILNEDFNGGIGGTCSEEQRGQTTAFSKLATTSIEGLGVFETRGKTIRIFSGYHELYVSKTAKEGKFDSCDVVYYPVIRAGESDDEDAVSQIESKNGNRLISVVFGYDGKVSELSVDEKAEIVEILSSLSIQ